MFSLFKSISNCLACGSSNITPSLNLGSQPLANAYLNSLEDQEETYPLAVNLCEDCCHLQLTHIVDPSIIYKNYLYVSGTTQTLKDYSEWFAGFVLENINLKTHNVLDIGCNDGTQLDYFSKRGFKTFGIDPAENLYNISSLRHDVICDFFNGQTNKQFSKEYDAIVAQNVVAHNPNPLEFLNYCKEIMSEHTKLFIQTSQANMVLNNEFDTIYHEHINFFNIRSMRKLVERAGIFLVDAIRTPIHGTSYVFIISKKNSNTFRINNAEASESKLNKKETYAYWESEVVSNMKNLKETLDTFRNQGYQIIGYGAAAKGNTLLNYIRFSLDYIIDDNPLKQGLYTPGRKIPITSIDILKNLDVNIVFLPLAWNFFIEICHRIKSVRNNSEDLFLKYFPTVEIKKI